MCRRSRPPEVDCDLRYSKSGSGICLYLPQETKKPRQSFHSGGAIYRSLLDQFQLSGPSWHWLERPDGWLGCRPKDRPLELVALEQLRQQELEQQQEHRHKLEQQLGQHKLEQQELHSLELERHKQELHS